MVAARDDGQVFVVHRIDQPVGVVDAARPESGKVFAQRLGFADSGEWRAKRIGQEGIDALQGLAILRLPIEIIGPGFAGPGKASIHRSIRVPALRRPDIARWSGPDVPHWPAT